METKKTTAVDYLIERIIPSSTLPIKTINEFIEQAKAIEKEQMQLAKKESYNEGWLEATQYIFKKYKQQEDDKI